MGFIAADNTIWAVSNFGDSIVLSPTSERTVFTTNISIPGSIIQVIATANCTLDIDLFRNDRLELRWSDTDFQRNVQLTNIGIWTIKMRNNSTENYCNVNASIELKEMHTETEFSYLWLRTPLLFAGGIVVAIPATSLFISKFNIKITRKTAKTLGIIFFFVLILFSYQIGGLMLGTSNPWMVCEGTSMEPAINAGDLVILSGTNPVKLAPEDIILFKEITIDQSGQTGFLAKPVIHRIFYINKNNNQTYIKTKGDNNPTPDDWLVPSQAILGKAVFIIPKVGLVMLFLERIEVKIIIIAVILFFAFAWPSVKPALKAAVSSKETREKESDDKPVCMNEMSEQNHLVPMSLMNS